MNRSIFHLAFLFAVTAIAGVPEPDLVFYGRVTGSPPNTAYVPASVTWTLSGNAETLSVSRTTVVSVNGETFYLTHILLETRQLADGTVLPASLNTLSVPVTTTTYTRSAIVDGQAVEFVNASDATLTLGPAGFGMVQRVELRLPGARDVDSDGDGMPDSAELLAGTDPHDSNSVLKAYSELRPELVGGDFAGIVIEWQSVPERRYVVERSEKLGGAFVTAGPPVIAATARSRFADSQATGGGPFFYRIRIE